MGIIDRLGDVIRSYLNEDDPGKNSPGRQRYADPDLTAAYEELDDFLERKQPGKTGSDDFSDSADTRQKGSQGQRNNFAGTTGRASPPESLRRDFAELGLPFGSTEEDCKAAYKRLLKLHHPDRHAGHEGNMKKATEKSVRINAAYDRIAQWRKTGIGG